MSLTYFVTNARQGKKRNGNLKATRRQQKQLELCLFRNQRKTCPAIPKAREKQRNKGRKRNRIERGQYGKGKEE